MPSFLRKNIPTLVFLLLVYSWFLFSNIISKPSSNLAVLGADANISLFVQPEAGRKPMLEAINNAKKEIFVEVYLLSDKQIIEALDSAENRGVDVRVLLEKNPFGGGNLNNIAERTLREKEVNVKWANSKYDLTHQKSMVIDAAYAFILNQNLTAAASTKNREFNIIDTNPEDVEEIRNIFLADWERRDYNPKETHLILSPINSRSALTTLIKSARKSIEIEMEYIEDEEIVNLLTQRAKDVSVDLIVPTFSQFPANKEAVGRLVEGGAEVRNVSSPYIHAKMILIDDKKAYVGSINFSTQSMDENRELGIMVTQTESIEEINNTFSSDWESGASIVYSPEYMFLVIDKYLSAVL